MSCFHSSLTKTTKFWTNHILKLTQKPYSYLCVLPIAFIFQYFHYRGSIRYAGGMMKGGALPCRVQWLSRNIPELYRWYCHSHFLKFSVFWDGGG